VTRIEAQRIALDLMRKHLEPHWFTEVTKRGEPQPCLTLRGVQIKNDLADALLAVWKEAYAEGYEEGQADLRESL
jgi:hypothetical protein